MKLRKVFRVTFVYIMYLVGTSIFILSEGIYKTAVYEIIK
jgi:hypothetical protein